MAQVNSTVPILRYVVLLVYEEEGSLVARNYLCEVTKGEFEKIVKRNIPKETHFIESAVNASDKVITNRSKTGSIDFDIKTGEIELTPAIKIGAFGLKTDIGKIYDALGDTTIGSAAGIEEVFNQIRNSEIKENEIDNIELKYDKYLTDNGIVNNNKNGYSSHYNKNIYFKNYKIEIPEYYKNLKMI